MLLDDLVARLQKTHGDRLISVLLYGSAVAGDQPDTYSDYNVLCVLTKVGIGELDRSEAIFRWWREQGNPSPLLLSRDEFLGSTDIFAIEYHDIRERHRVLYGENLALDVHIDDRFYRARVEFELRANLLRLRQKAAGVLADKQLLLRLMADSVSTFATVLRHALRLHGDQAGFDKRAIVAQTAQRFGGNVEPWNTLLDLRAGKKLSGVEPRQLFRDYLTEIERVVAAINRLER